MKDAEKLYQDFHTASQIYRFTHKGVQLPQELQNRLSNNDYDWNLWFDFARENGSSELADNLLNLRLWRTFPSNLSQKFWEYLCSEIQKENPEVIAFVAIQRDGILVNTPSEYLDFFVDSVRKTDPSNGVLFFHSLISNKVWSKIDPTIKKNLILHIAPTFYSNMYWNRISLTDINILSMNGVEEIWDELFDDFLQFEDKTLGLKLLKELCAIKTQQSLRLPPKRIHQFWTMYRQTELEMDIVDFDIPLQDDHLQFLAAEQVLRKIRKIQNPRPEDVYFFDDQAWDEGRVDGQAYLRFKSSHIEGPLRKLLKLLSMLKDQISSGSSENKTLYDQLLRVLRDLRTKEYVEIVFKLYPSLREQANAFLGKSHKKEETQASSSSSREESCKVLGITLEESKNPLKVNEAYRKQSLKYHPDRVGPEGKQMMQSINHARDVLRGLV